MQNTAVTSGKIAIVLKAETKPTAAMRRPFVVLPIKVTASLQREKVPERSTCVSLLTDFMQAILRQPMAPIPQPYIIKGSIIFVVADAEDIRNKAPAHSTHWAIATIPGLIISHRIPAPRVTHPSIAEATPNSVRY